MKHSLVHRQLDAFESVWCDYLVITTSINDQWQKTFVFAKLNTSKKKKKLNSTFIVQNTPQIQNDVQCVDVD